MTLSIEELKEMRSEYGIYSVASALDELIAIREQQGKAYGYYSAETATILEQQGHANISAEPLADSRFPLFTAPQKPVVPCPTYCPHCSYSLHPEKAQEERNAERKAAIEAAGGLVKDGE